jgi:ferredoxin--NADP+ reductase
MTQLSRKNNKLSNPLSDARLFIRTVEKVINHTREIFEIHLSRHNHEFSPGQYLSLFSDESNVCREYSIASGINEPRFGFIIKHLEAGKVTEFLYQLQPQDIIQTSLPAGSFRPGSEHRDGNFIFIITGIGIAPFLSYLKSYPEQPPLKLLYGVRYLQDAIGYPELSKLCPLQLAISREEIKGHHHGRVTNLLKTLPSQQNIHYYLCGLDAMIQQVSDWLHHHGIDSHHIHHEVFVPKPEKYK